MIATSIYYYHLQDSTVLLSSLINALIICNLLCVTQLHAFNVIFDNHRLLLTCNCEAQRHIAKHILLAH